MSGEARPWAARGDAALIAHAVSPTRSAQSSSRRALVECLRRRPDARWRVLDLGCGTGRSYEYMVAAHGNLDWVGLDIPDSPEVRLRQRRDLRFVTFDGVRIPLAAGTFDVIYAHQVFEHVRRADQLLDEAARVLAHDGVLVGSTSQLEPLHSRSRCNFTPYGFLELLEAAGFREVELRPGIDGLTLVGRRIFSFAKLARPFNFFFETESPLNVAIELFGRLFRLDAQARSLLKLVFAGQFVFIARKASDP